MRVLVACEFSGIVRDAFTRAGHYAMSADVLETEAPGEHYTGDVRDVLDDSWDVMIAHPPCTYLANSGVSWLHRQPERWEKMVYGAKFFRELLNAPIKHKAIENSIMHKYAAEVVGRRQDQVVQPWMFGHTEQKATCLWLDNLPKLTPTSDVRKDMMALPENERQRLHYLPPSPDRWRIRSRTFQGIADAMAKQWGEYAINSANN